VKLTRGERRALLCYAPVLIGFLPPVIVWVADVRGTVLGIPFILFWTALMVAVTAALMTLALFVVDRSDGR
jgi:hypothetical protein